MTRAALVLLLLSQKDSATLAERQALSPRFVPAPLATHVVPVRQVDVDGWQRVLVCRAPGATVAQLVDGGLLSSGTRVVLESEERLTARTAADLGLDGGADGGLRRYVALARVGLLGADGGWVLTGQCSHRQTDDGDAPRPWRVRSCPYLLPDGGNLCTQLGGLAEVAHQCVRQRCRRDGGFVGTCLQSGRAREGAVCAGNVFPASEASGTGCQPVPCVVFDGQPEEDESP